MADHWEKLIGNEAYKIDLRKVVDYNKRNDPHPSGRSLRFYTSHGYYHCQSVENMVLGLIEKSNPQKTIPDTSLPPSLFPAPLKDLELFILFCSVWTHDLGMNDNNSKDFFEDWKKDHPDVTINDKLKRELHDESSAFHLNQKYSGIFTPGTPMTDPFTQQKYRAYVDAINLISKYHRTKNDIEECPKEYFLEKEKIRARLLASFLRFGDTLHVDSSRFDRSTYDFLQIGQMDRSSRFHWIKSYIINGISLEPDKEIIRVHISIPEQIKKDYEDDDDLLTENIKNLESVVTRDIFNDMHHVSKVFKDNKFPVYSEVVAETNYIPGYNQEDFKVIEGIISDLGIAASPNTSKVIEKAIDSIYSICSTKYDSSDSFIHEMEQLIKHLDEIHQQKSSHVGLWKIINTIEKIFNEKIPRGKRSPPSSLTLVDVENCKNEITKAINSISQTRRDATKKIFSDSNKKGGILFNVDNIILFAYSEMVLNYIDRFGSQHADWKNNITIYVLECSGKRRVSSNNDIEYNDGLHYSQQLSRRGFKNIYLLPDTSFGSLLSELKTKNAIERSIVLFGVNGINEENGDCIHDSGHLMISIIAHNFGVKVFVIADTFKIGELKEWTKKSRFDERETPWLTTKRSLLKTLKHNKIILKNYKEDLIPCNCIESIITEEGNSKKIRFVKSGKRRDKK